MTRWEKNRLEAEALRFYRKMPLWRLVEQTEENARSLRQLWRDGWVVKVTNSAYRRVGNPRSVIDRPRANDIPGSMRSAGIR